MIDRFNPRIALGAASLAAVSLAAPVSGQGFVTNETAGSVTGKHYWGPLSDATFGAAVTGEFDGDGQLDAVVLDDGAPVLLLAPALYLTAIYAPVTAADVAVLPGHGPGGTDSLAVVGADGFTEHWFDTAQGGWRSTTHQGPGWAQPTDVAVGDVDGDGDLDVVATGAADPLAVHVVYGDGAGGFGTTAQFASALPVYDVDVADWDGDGDGDYVLRTDYGLEIYDTAFQPLWWYPWSWGEVVLAPLAVAGTSRSRLAVVATDLVGLQYLVVFGQGVTEGPWGLGALGVVSAVAGDHDGDGDDDLLLGVTTAASVYALENFEGTGGDTFDPAGGMTAVPVGDPSRDPSANGAGLGIGDFTGDGDLDWFVPIQGDATSETQIPGQVPSTVHVVANRDDVDETVWHPAVTESRFFYTQGVAFDVEITVAAPAQVLPAGPGETTEIEILVWHTAAIGQPTEVAPAVVTMPVPASTDTFTLVTGETGYQFPDAWGLVLRQVVRDAGGAVVAEGPATTAVYAGYVGYTELEDVIGVTGTLLAVNGTPQVGGIIDSIHGGGVVLGPGVPPFDEDEQPTDT